MAKSYFKPSAMGQDGLRNSPKVQKALLSCADEVKRSAESFTSGLAYTTDVQTGKHRAHARCSTANDKAFFVQMRTKNLASALDAARG